MQRVLGLPKALFLNQLINMVNNIILGYNTKTISVSLVAGQRSYNFVNGNVGIPPRALVVGIMTRMAGSGKSLQDKTIDGVAGASAFLTMLDKTSKEILTSVPIYALDPIRQLDSSAYVEIRSALNEVLIEPCYAEEIDFANSTITLTNAAATIVKTGNVLEFTILYTDENAQPVDFRTSSYPTAATTAGTRCKAVFVNVNAINKEYSLYNQVGLDDDDIIIGFRPFVDNSAVVPSTSATTITNVAYEVLNAAFIELKTTNGSAPLDNCPFWVRYPVSIHCPYFPLVPRRYDEYNWQDSKIKVTQSTTTADNTAFILLIYYVKP